MKYYFVDRTGRITTEEAHKDWIYKEVPSNVFTNKKAAISAAKKKVKSEIHLLKQRLKELRCKS